MIYVADIRLIPEDGWLLLVARGELDLLNAPALQEALSMLTSDARNPLVDLRDVAYLDSEALRQLGRAAASLRPTDRDLVVMVRPNSLPERVLHLCGWKRLVRICHSLDEAARPEESRNA
jgi:anti-anti-sigma factor